MPKRKRPLTRRDEIEALFDKVRETPSLLHSLRTEVLDFIDSLLEGPRPGGVLVANPFLEQR